MPIFSFLSLLLRGCDATIEPIPGLADHQRFLDKQPDRPSDRRTARPVLHRQCIFRRQRHAGQQSAVLNPAQEIFINRLEYAFSHHSPLTCCFYMLNIIRKNPDLSRGRKKENSIFISEPEMFQQEKSENSGRLHAVIAISRTAPEAKEPPPSANRFSVTGMSLIFLFFLRA